MSLQEEFELCLEYAKAFEMKERQQEQIQSNIEFIQNESEKLSNRLGLLKKLIKISAVILAIVVPAAIISGALEMLSVAVFCVLILLVCIPYRKKTKQEFEGVEASRPAIIEKYTQEAEACRRELVALAEEIIDKDLFDIIPEEYFTVAAIEFCLSQIRRKLASTSKEVFLRLDAEIKRLEHMEHLEQLNNAQLESMYEIKRAIDINTLVTLSEQNRR